MSKRIYPEVSPRYGIKYNKIPTVRGSVFGGSVVRHYTECYGNILDSVCEMADVISTGNGISIERAIDVVCKDENWSVLPSDKKKIIEKIKEMS